MLVLTGKTCSGKDTIKKELIKLGLKPVTTYTTRPMRNGEIDGESYYFITKDDFIEKAKDGFFAECTYYRVANGETWYYGSRKEDYSDDCVMILNPGGVKDLLYIQRLEPLIVYIDATDETISKRLISRGDNPDEAKRRLQADCIDFLTINKMCDMFISNDGEFTPEEIATEIYNIYEALKGK